MAHPHTPRARTAAVVLSAAIGILALLYVVDVALAWGEIPRGVEVRGVDLGGMSTEQARATLRERFGEAARAPFAADAAGVALTIEPTRAGLSLDDEATVKRARTQALNPLSRLTAFFVKTEVDLVGAADSAKLEAELTRLAKAVNQGPREGAVRFDGVRPVAVEPRPGRQLDLAGSAGAIEDRYLHADRYTLPSDTFSLPVTETPVKSRAADVQRVLRDFAQPAVSAPVLLTGAGRTVPMQPAAIAKSLRIEADADGTITPVVVPKALRAALGTTLAPIEVLPKDAGFVINGKTVSITPSADGRVVDVDALAVSLLPVLPSPGGRTVALPVVPKAAKVTTARAQSLGIREEIGGFTTYHPCCRPRVHNIQLMARIVDGAVVLPGETFSLNGFVGPRDRRRGFLDAPMILNGEFVDAVGGGVSQFATTMFNAVFFSGMKDIEHKPHSYYISRYPPGREATVSHPTPDLKWQNDSPHGVLIKTAYTSKSITVTFWGTKRYTAIEAVAGPRTRYRGVYTEYRSGRTCESRSGAPGFDIAVNRLFKQGSKVVRTERFFTRYLVESRIVCGSRPASPPPSPPPSPQPSASPTG